MMRAITPPRVAWTSDAFHVFARLPLRRRAPLVPPRAATAIGDTRALCGVLQEMMERSEAKDFKKPSITSSAAKNKRDGVSEQWWFADRCASCRGTYGWNHHCSSKNRSQCFRLDSPKAQTIAKEIASAQNYRSRA